MDLNTALEILELSSDNLTSDLIKKAYRRLSLKYHPDISQEADGSKFIMINAAYEYLLKNLPHINANEFEETKDELNNRIIAIRKAFTRMYDEYSTKHNKIFEEMVDKLVQTLNNYSSHRSLRNGINYDFQRIIVDGGLNEIIYWVNSRIIKIVSAYDEWINGYLRSTYKKLLEEEFRLWYKSTYFFKHFLISLLISEIFFIIPYYYIENTYFRFVSVIPVIVGIIFYRINVNKKFSFKVNILTLDRNKFQIQASNLMVTTDDADSKEQAALGLGGLGAMVGSVGGPIGAVIGGAIGGILGSIFGESLDELRQKLYDRLLPKIYEVENICLSYIENQLPKVEEELISSIKDNFSRNKQQAVKLLIGASK